MDPICLLAAICDALDLPPDATEDDLEALLSAETEACERRESEVLS